MNGSLPNGGHAGERGHSTLEVYHPPHAYTEIPEVDREATARYDGLEVVKHEVDNFPKVEQANVPEVRDSIPPGSPQILGLRRRTFWILVAFGVVLVVAGAIAGAVVGTSAKQKSGSDAEPSEESSSSSNQNPNGLYNGSKLATANFTDEAGHANYLVFYQLNSGALQMSTWNSSSKRWLVSPVTDGNKGVGPELVKKGAAIGVDVYRHHQFVSNNYLVMSYSGCCKHDWTNST
jgi:hypothetical protein